MYKRVSNHHIIFRKKSLSPNYASSFFHHRSKKEQGLFLVIDPKADALQKSLSELQIFDNTEDAVMVVVFS